VCEILKFKLPSSIVTPGYSGYWPGYSGHRVSIFLIWSSGPHNHLNRKSLSPSPSQLTLPLPSRALSPSHSLPHEPSLSLTSTPSSLSPRPQDLQVQVDSKAKGTSIGVENHPLHSFLLGGGGFGFNLRRRCRRGSRIRSGCGATRAAGASPAGGGSWGVGPRPHSPQR